MGLACARIIALCLSAAVYLTPTTALAQADQAALRALLADARTEMNLPGLRAAVRQPDGRMVAAAVGVADEDRQTALTDDIGMPGGSTGKTFVAALTMLLVEDGAIALDDTAAQYVGERAWFQKLPNASTMQIRHLLSHSAGLKDYPYTFRFTTSMISRVIRHGSARYEPEELIAFVRARRGEFEAGAGYNYTDAGYLVLGRVLEAATGQTYYDLLATHILEPHELAEIRPQTESVLTGVATGYSGGSSVFRDDGRMKFDPSSEWTGGGLITTPTLLVRFYAALAAGEIVSAESFQRMVNGGWRNEDATEHYGYGLFVDTARNQISHGGLWPGYRTHVMHDLNNGITIAVQTNRDGRVDLAGLVERIAQAPAVTDQ